MPSGMAITLAEREREKRKRTQDLSESEREEAKKVEENAEKPNYGVPTYSPLNYFSRTSRKKENGID